MAWLSTFEVGVRAYIETDLKDMASRMRAANPPVSRRPEHMKEWVFETRFFTAVPSQATGDIRYLICVERRK